MSILATKNEDDEDDSGEEKERIKADREERIKKNKEWRLRWVKYRQYLDYPKLTLHLWPRQQKKLGGKTPKIVNKKLRNERFENQLICTNCG